jgi:DNA-binding NtrC family response regulator
VSRASIPAQHEEDNLPNAEPASAAGRADDSSTTVPAARATPVAETTPAGTKPRILALDDEPSIRSMLRTVLTRAGMDCQPFPDGAHALEGLREADFDVMLIDHKMPLMTGTEFYEAAIEYRPELGRRAIFMSGDVLNPDLRGFATQRGIRLLAKPFDIEAVVRIVKEALEANGNGEA